MIRLSDIHKSFGAVYANRGASLDVAAREIHALVGENGAGKSTLMRILSGMFPADSGRIEVDGKDVSGWTTADAIASGVGMVHQHFMLVPTLTVTENVMLGAEITRGLQLDRQKAEHDVQALVQRTGLVVPTRQRVSELTVGEAQRVEILKTLYRGARVLILDEPTAVLSPPEVHELWRVLRRLRDDGGTIVLITHKLDEVMAVSDSITVMRHGATVGRLKTSDTSPREIARMMVGRDVALAQDSRAPAGASPSSGARPLLDVRNLVVASSRRANVVDDVSFSVAAGEILGVAGVEGNGQTELIEAIAGLRHATGGTVLLDGTDVTRASVRARGDLGLSHIPEDRHERGLVLEYTLAENLILGQQHRFTRAGALDRTRIEAHARHLIEKFDVRPADATLPARALSGGNQQKIVIAREMAGGRSFTVLLAAQPTRGVDVGAIEFIHGQLRAARAAGKAVLLVSADLTEVLALSDRVAVMYGGRVVAIVPGASASAEQLGPYMMGVSAGAAA
ncbi:MAG TPA: ABC transporter ATP-binding protein [Gemmatimonadaceae bacterium]|nr:ABC transporter ATP-binding protein [Gemmatimonadaceae bacterium]